MKKRILNFVLLIATMHAFGQEEPFGFSIAKSELKRLPVEEVATFDHQQLLAEDQPRDKYGISYYGRVAFAGFNIENSGTWFNLDNGDKVWFLRVHSAGALEMGAIFDHYYLPIGASLFVYDINQRHFEGPYNAEENNSHGLFRTAETLGDDIVIEYYEPATVVGKATLITRGFSHIYRMAHLAENIEGGVRAADTCEVDVRCPEGTPWADQRQSVVRLSIVAGNTIGACSGSLINNLNYDCKNYILTADHCINDITNASDYGLLSVRFNFQRSGCGTGIAPSSNQRTGVTRRADSNDNGGQSGSDFALLEMEEAPNSAWNPYYAGWDASGNATPTGMCIHHPDGDVKKISYAQNIVNGSWGVANTHWKVTWGPTVTHWGVTEPGSSGSPLYNSDRRIIGTLTGGYSFCYAQTANDYYGKVSKHWTSNPNPSTEKLKVWLDPNNTGFVTCDGSYAGTGNTPCFGTVSVDEIKFSDIKIFPTLADGLLNIQMSDYKKINQVKLYNNVGALVDAWRVAGASSVYDVSSLSNGMYYISFIGENGTFVTQKFTVNHP
jgi:V8-like Glu-specific endopeptidase